MRSGVIYIIPVEMGRQFIGIERVQRYFDVACRRVADALARPDMFIEKPTRAARTEQPVGLFDITGR